MANEFVARKGLIISGSTRASGSVTATSFTGSLFGTSSFATTSSFTTRKFITVTGSAPTDPLSNDLWYDDTTGKTYIYYVSASVSQWVLQADPTYDPGPSIQDLQDVTDVGSITTNAITIANTTAATNTGSGALLISGGLGVKGAIYSNTVTATTITATTINGTLNGSLVGTSSWASSSITASYVLPSGLPVGTVSSSTQFTSLTAPFTGSFTGSFIGILTGTGSWSNTASVAITSSYVLPSGLPSGLVSSSAQFTSLTAPFTGSFTGSFRGNLTGTGSWANTASVVVTNTVSYTAGAGLSGGGTATLGGSSVTIDVVAGAGISLTAPTNDAINIDTGSTHFTGGVKSKLNTDGVVSSSTQFTSLTAPFTGSFTGSFRGSLTGTGSWANTSSVATSASYALTASFALNGGTGTAGNSFATFSIAGQSDVIADSVSDTLNLIAGTGITLTTNPATDAITINATAASPQAFNTDRYTFVGDGTTVNYNVVNSYAINSLLVSVDGLTYTPVDDYTISTNTLTFVTPPPSQSSILVNALVNATTGITGSFTGSFGGVFTGTSSWAVSASWAPGGAGTVTQVIAGAGLGGGTITSTGTITLDTSSVHFLDGVKKELNTEGVVSSSTQFTSLNAPFTGSFTGSFRGSLIGTGSWAQSSSVATSASYALSASYAPGGSGTVTQIIAGNGLSGGTITNTGTIALDTSSVHFLDGVKKELNTEGVISSSTQFISLTAPFTGSFTGSFRGNLTGTASVVTTNTVSYTAGAGLSGGGTATLGGSSVTIDAVAGAGISLTAPTNDAINIDTGSTHFTGGVKSKLNVDGVISSSTQFTSLTAPFTGSFTGSFRGNTTGSFSGSIDRFNPSTLRITVGTTAPTSPSVNDLWVDTN